MKKISSNIIYEYLKNNSISKHINDEYFEFIIENDQTIFVFKNLSSSESISISNSFTYGQTIKFIDCDFIRIDFGRFKRIHIINCKICNIILNGQNYDSEINDIIFDNNTTIQLIEFSQNIRLENLKLFNSSSVNSIVLKSSSFIKYIEIKDSATISLFLLKNSEIGYINVNNKIKIAQFNLIKSKLNNLSITKSYINSIKIESSEILTINLYSNSLLGNLHIDHFSKVNQFNSTITSQIGDIECLGYNSSFDLNSRISKLCIKSQNYGLRFKINNCIISELTLEKNSNGSISIYIEASTIEKLLISYSWLISSDLINISNTKIRNLKIDNLINSGRIYLVNLYSPNTFIETFQREAVFNEVICDENEEGFKGKFLKKDNIESNLSLISSDLGLINFLSFNFNVFKKLEFINSNILNGFISNTKLPDDIVFNLKSNTNNLSNTIELDQKRLFFSQIKSTYYRQGDFIRASITQAKELETYRNQLRLFNDNFNWYWYNWFLLLFHEREFGNTQKDRAVLFLNRWTSNYGTNWLRSTITTLLVLWITFWIYCGLLGYRFGYDLNKFSVVSSYSFQYLNPFRDEDSGDFFKQLSSDFGNNYKIPAIARIWDYFSRIIIAFMVYQTISAFRKLGKSGS